MIATKYESISFEESNVISDIKRLINQVWKLIPMKENNENWKKQIVQVLVETAGLQELFQNRIDLLIILSKLEGLKEFGDTIAFIEFRSLVFSIISLLSKANERII